MRISLVRQVLVCIFLLAGPLEAVEFEGVQPASLDQPRVNVLIRRTPNGEPLVAKAGKMDAAAGKLLEGLLGDLAAGGEASAFNVQAFLDTGASGIVLSRNTADALGLVREKSKDGQRATFHDIGVAGSDAFHVSETFHAALAPFHPNIDTEDGVEAYGIAIGPVRAQVSTGGVGDGLLEMVLSNLDVFGMPAMIGKVVVMDPRPVNTMTDTMRTYVYKPGTPFNPAESKFNPGIPKTDRHVMLSYASFKRFTHVTPDGAPWPSITHNPFIGPNPIAHFDPIPKPDKTPGIVIRHGQKTATGSWLLDTGAAASIISRRQAESVGVTYVEGTYGSGAPILAGVAKERQFSITVGGIGGSTKAAGFFLDELRLPTREGDPIVYKSAPVLVLDITVEEPQTRQTYTIEGVFGMNFLVASAFVSEMGLLPELGEMTEGPYDWIVFDEPRGVLGLKLRE